MVQRTEIFVVNMSKWYIEVNATKYVVYSY